MSRNPFNSTYTKDYIWHDNVERPSLDPGFNIVGIPEFNANYLQQEDLKPKTGEEAGSVMQLLRKLRMNTVYRESYCTPRVKEDSSADPFQDDELMDSMERILSTSKPKVLPPPDTSRVVHGFRPKRRFYTGRSFYTDMHSRLAYDALKRKILERGVCRLAPLPIPREEFEKDQDYSIPPCRMGKVLERSTWIHRKPDPYA